MVSCFGDYLLVNTHAAALFGFVQSPLQRSVRVVDSRAANGRNHGATCAQPLRSTGTTARVIYRAPRSTPRVPDPTAHVTDFGQSSLRKRPTLRPAPIGSSCPRLCHSLLGMYAACYPALLAVQHWTHSVAASIARFLAMALLVETMPCTTCCKVHCYKVA